MNASNSKEKKESLLKFAKSNSIALFKNAISGIIGRPVHCLFFDDRRLLIEKENIKHRGRLSLSKKIQVLRCACNKFYLSIPILQGDNLYGYVVVLHLPYKLDQLHLNFIRSFIEVTLKEFQKEQELTRLYDTIRPRAIALSTIHTIHRLLTSTLDMDELIERIARLASQVMRARFCSIMLLDGSKKYLLSKAVIDLKNNSKKMVKRPKRIRVGRKIPGVVAKTGKAYFSHNWICVPLVEEDIIGVICVKSKINNAPFDRFDLEILITLAEQAVIAIKNAQLYEEQEKMAYGSIKSLATLLDTKSPNTYTHTEQFVKIILAIAEEMKLPKEGVRNLRYAALLPDTGRFSIPDEILKKQDVLSGKEYDTIKKQHLESLKILEPLEFLKPVMPIIMHHHERYNGTGYPDGLKGKKIPLGARIMAVADAFEAMVSSRPYKNTKISMQQALREIENNKGIQFDPDVVGAFMSIAKRPEFERLFL